MGIIKPSQSDYSSPYFPILKKTGNLRLVIDYRELNAITRQEQHPVPSLHEQLDDLRGSRWFST